MRKTVSFIVGFVLCFSAYCQSAKEPDSLSFEQQVRAYVENYPFIIMVQTCKKMTDPTSVGKFAGAAPFETFYHGNRLQDYRERLVVNPNHDTVMSSAWVNLQNGAKYLLTMPPLPKNRYFSVSILDMWTNVLKVISTRTVAGRGEQKIILVGSSGEVKHNEESSTVQSPTDAVWIIVRISAKSEADMNEVRALQKKVQFVRLAGAAADNATACSLNDAQKKLVRSANFADIKKQAESIMQDALFKSHTRVNGWSSNLNEEKIDPKLRRAAIAFEGLGALPPSEAVYFMTDDDSNDQQLIGGNCYKVHFDAIPPADAFWSLSAYDKKTALFEKNSIDRYSIGSSTNGLYYNADKSLDILLTHDQPDKCAKGAVNWLPLPAQECFIVLRLYHPRKEVLDGNYLPPKVEKVK